MGAVGVVRKALQDVIAPDLKALQVEVKEGFASVERQFASVEKLCLRSVTICCSLNYGMHRSSRKLGAGLSRKRWTSISGWSGSKRGRHRSSLSLGALK
jgi:hypothetical protein